MKEALQPSGVRKSRWQFIDFVRGAAIVAMICYHAVWNFGYFHVIPAAFVHGFIWQAFGATIAASFLIISGISLQLAHGNGIRVQAFCKRLIRIAGAAVLVTAATWYLFPDSYIFFGILHCLAVTSILALPFLRAPLWLGLVTIVFALIAPSIFRQAFWDARWLEWLGFGQVVPQTNDYIPIFPWFAYVVLGVLIARVATGPHEPMLGGFIVRTLSAAGRFSLVIYLLHQPILFGLTQAAVSAGILAPASGVPAANTLRTIAQQCEQQCNQDSDDPPLCRATCRCMLDEIVGNPARASLLQNLLDNDLSAQAYEQIQEISRNCADVIRQDR